MSINLHQKFFLGPALSTYVIRLAENSISKFCSIYRYNTWPRASWSIEIAGKFRKYPCTSVTQYLWIIISAVPCLSVRVLAPAINSSYKIWHGEPRGPVRESWKRTCNKCVRESSQDLTPQLRTRQPYPTTSGSQGESSETPSLSLQDIAGIHGPEMSLEETLDESVRVFNAVQKYKSHRRVFGWLCTRCGLCC